MLSGGYRSVWFIYALEKMKIVKEKKNKKELNSAEQTKE